MKKDYMTRLERAARWRLPPQEAEEVISDYRDMFNAQSRSEEELRREVGDPEQVINLLVSPPKAYRIWQAAFAVMAFCILTVGISGTLPGFAFFDLYFFHWWFGPRYSTDPPSALLVAALGAATALVWFRWKGYKNGHLPKAVPILLGVLTLWTGGILLFDWFVLRDPVAFSESLGRVPSLLGPNITVSLSYQIFSHIMAYSAVGMAVLGTFALVKARTQDRRWAAVYVLAMASLLVPLLILDMIGSMDPSPYDLSAELWYLPELVKYAATFAAGLVGAGVALC